MDWIGIIVFILFMVLKAFGESEKQKKQRQARQQKMSPPKSSPTIPAPASPELEVPRPVVKPEFDLPPVLPFPLFELFEEDWEEKQVAKEVLEEPEIKPQPPSPPPALPQEKGEPELTTPVPRSQPTKEAVLPGLQLSQAVEGVIWAEILSPPRALRPFKR